MKIYAVLTKRRLIRKEWADNSELNDKFFDTFESEALFNNYKNASDYFNNETTEVKVVHGYFGIDYYAICSVILNELIIDDSIIDAEKLSEEWLNDNREIICDSIIIDNMIASKITTINELKNYIKEGK